MQSVYGNIVPWKIWPCVEKGCRPVARVDWRRPLSPSPSPSLPLSPYRFSFAPSLEKKTEPPLSLAALLEHMAVQETQKGEFV